MKENRVCIRKCIIILLIIILLNIYATAYQNIGKHVFLTTTYAIDEKIETIEEPKEKKVIEQNKETKQETKTTEVVKKETKITTKKTETTAKKEEKKVTTVKKEPVQNKQTTVKQEVKTKNKITVNGVLSKPLMKDEKGDNYYLNHSLTGVEDNIGVPYIDFRTSFSGRKVIIYAHSSKSGNGPFQGLQNYHNNKAYFNNHRYIEIEYENKKYKYEIFSVYVAAAEDKDSEVLEYFYKVNYSRNTWEKAIKNYKSKSEYDTGVEVSANDKIIILQTCSMDSKYYRKYYRYNLLVMGKLISES